jgi:uncharacterized protein (DUF111 family)
MRTVKTPHGDVRVKIAYMGTERVNMKPEFEDCKLISAHTGVPLKHVTQAAIAAIENMMETK